MKLKSRWLKSVLTMGAAGMLTTSCGDATLTQTESAHTENFLSVSREDTDGVTKSLSQGLEVNAQNALKGQVTSDNFYVAIHKSQLGKRFFLSTYLKQIYPSYSKVGAESQGTRVVTFKVQNGNVVMMDVDDRRELSDTFNPELIVDAFPLVEDFAPFKKVSGWRNYVLFNPAEGKNEYSVFGDFSDVAFNVGASEGVGQAMKVQASFLQRFRGLGNGVAFDTVFSGTTLSPDAQSVQNWGGTLTTSIREYAEGEGFEAVPAPEVTHFFTGLPKYIPNTGAQSIPVAKWNIKPGMTPIRWTISSTINELAKDPRFAAYDVVGAVKRGVENWNEAFGFKALEAVVGNAKDSQGDDDKNFLVIDTDPSLGFAFADVRVNPNTGETLGASVYFNAGWFDYADAVFPPDDAPQEITGKIQNGKLAKFRKAGGALSNLSLERQAKRGDDRAAAILRERKATSGSRLNLGSQANGGHLCKLSIADLASQNSVGADPLNLPKKEKVERFITHVILHEVGHTLGLRHNFKGSLLPPSSSVMDYLSDDDSVPLDKPGAYDVDAMKYLYLKSGTLPTQPFCNDSGVLPPNAPLTDPLCMLFDHGSDPLNDDYGPRYDATVKFILDTPDLPVDAAYMGGWDQWMLQLHLTGIQQERLVTEPAKLHEERMKAFEYLTKALRSVDREKAKTDSTYLSRVEALVYSTYSWMFSGEPQFIPEIGDIFYYRPTITDAELNAKITSDLKAIALDEKHVLDQDPNTGFVFIRGDAISWSLKHYQTEFARQALVELRTELAEQSAAHPEEKNKNDELITLVNKALDPYVYR